MWRTWHLLWLVPLVMNVVCCFETLSDLQNHVRNWCYGGSDTKRPRLESQSSEEEENDNIAFINMANEIKEETEERFKAHGPEIPSRWLYAEAG